MKTETCGAFILIHIVRKSIHYEYARQLSAPQCVNSTGFQSLRVRRCGRSLYSLLLPIHKNTIHLSTILRVSVAAADASLLTFHRSESSERETVTWTFYGREERSTRERLALLHLASRVEPVVNWPQEAAVDIIIQKTFEIAPVHCHQAPVVTFDFRPTVQSHK